MARFSILVIAVVAAGCQPVEDDTARTLRASTTSNGVALNGTKLYGEGLHAVYPNGLSFNGLSFNGLSFNGLSFNGLSFNGSELTGTTENGLSFNGVDFVGATMDSALTDGGEVVSLRIDDAFSEGDLFFYVVSYATPVESCKGKGSKRNCTTHEMWTPVCGVDDASQPIAGLLLEGAWDSPEAGGDGSRLEDQHAVTIACRGAALAKCVELGYEPWSGLASHHQACTRMLRADYCGTGMSHTVDGWVINVYDNLGIQQDTAQLEFEAEWGPDGATCLNHHRTEQLDRGTSYDGKPLDCELLASETCGDVTAPSVGTLLFNESGVGTGQEYDEY